MLVITQYKTTELVKLAHDNNKLIVCASREEAHRIHHKAYENGYNIHLPITYSEFINKNYNRRNIESILLDNVEAFIAHVSMVNVEAITMDLIIDDQTKNGYKRHPNPIGLLDASQGIKNVK